jgi:hypothetical protein
MDKNDTIQLVAKLEELSVRQSLSLKGVLEINGNIFHPEFVLDVTELAKSCQSSGEIDIFTCGCGQPMCAGIGDGIRVEHLPEDIIWHFSEPMSDRNYEDLSDDEWEAMKRPVELRFDPEHYLSAIAAGINKLKSLAVSSERPVELPMQGFMRDRLLALQTLVFSTRLNVPEKRLITRNIEIDAYNDSICVGGIYYRLEALLLPPTLVAAYKAWKIYAVFPNEEIDLPAYLVYLQKGREFCQSLKQYLGREAMVKFKYHRPKLYNPAAWEVIEEIR